MKVQIQWSNIQKCRVSLQLIFKVVVLKIDSGLPQDKNELAKFVCSYKIIVAVHYHGIGTKKTSLITREVFQCFNPGVSVVFQG